MSLIVDIAILGLLVGTLAYAVMVHRRVQAMMRALKELEPMIGDFSEAVDRSESAVSGLKSLAASVQAPFASRSRPAREEAAQDGAAFRTSREQHERSGNVSGIPVKSELVRGFFETVRSREA